MKRVRRGPRVVTALAVVAVLVLSACSSSGGGKFYKFTSATKVGTLIPVADRKPAADFSGDNLDGQGKLGLTSTAGKVAVVNFWASWCGPCQAETPALGQLYTQVKTKGITFLGIDFKDSSSNGKAFVADHGISYPMIFDGQGESAIKLGNPPASLPFTYLLDKHGRVAAVYVARFTMTDLQRVLDKLVAES